MSANIITIINGDVSTRLVGASRDDLKVGDIVQCYSDGSAVDTGYLWDLSYVPDGSLSGLVIDDNHCTFTVDSEGPYLIRLTVDPGSDFEDSQYLRLRSLTSFASLKLVAAGEQLGDMAIPSDMTGTGWASDQNYNLASLLHSLSIVSSSGRTLFVDANRGVDDDQAPDDEVSGYGNFPTIQDAIDCAKLHNSAPATSSCVWTVVVQGGLYQENLRVPVGVNLVSNGHVVIEQEDDQVPHCFGGGSAEGLIFNSDSLEPDIAVINIDGGDTVEFKNCKINRTSKGAGQGSCVVVKAISRAVFTSCTVGNEAVADKVSFGIGVEDQSELVLNDCYVYGAEGVLIFDGGGDAEITKSVIEANHVQGAAVQSAGTLDISHSELTSDHVGLIVAPSQDSPIGGGQTYVRFTKLSHYKYSNNMDVPDLKLVGVELDDSTEFHSDVEVQGSLSVEGSIQLGELAEQPQEEASLWVDEDKYLLVDDQRVAYTEDVKHVAGDVLSLENQLADALSVLSDLKTKFTELSAKVDDLETQLGDEVSLNMLHRKVVDEPEYTCHECDEYIGVRTNSGAEHIIHLEEDAPSGRRLYIVDETGLGIVRIRPHSSVANPTINGVAGDYLLENREGVHIVSDGQTDGGAVDWSIS